MTSVSKDDPYLKRIKTNDLTEDKKHGVNNTHNMENPTADNERNLEMNQGCVRAHVCVF